MRSRTDIVTTVLVVVALAMVGVLMRARFRDHAPRRPHPLSHGQTDSLSSAGSRFGPSEAPIRIVEFADFRCGVCKVLAPWVKELVSRNHPRVTVVYRHFPLSATELISTAAAVASECGAATGHFVELHDVLFASQDSLGRVSWSVLGARAGIRDTILFSRCIQSEEMRSRVDRDRQAGLGIGVSGTPAFVFRDRLYHGRIPDGDLIGAGLSVPPSAVLRSPPTNQDSPRR
jgi:protein-disulfide isomerase